MTGITGLHITKYLLRKTGVYFFLQMPETGAGLTVESLFPTNSLTLI